MSTPLISVVMPVHNAAPFVGEAIRSVLAQTVGDFELILIDDASTDDSATVIAEFRDPRIRCRRSDVSLNAAGARNIALAGPAENSSLSSTQMIWPGLIV